MNYKVVEIFDSIDGEGIRTGQPVSFIRLAGCNLRCSYCDTLYALFDEAEPCRYEEMSGEEILEKLNPRYMRVTLTGGEPLISQGIEELVDLLSDNGYEINIETNGAADIVDFMKRIKTRKNLFFTIDYKLLSSNMSNKMHYENFLALEERDVIKFVVGSRQDALQMLEITRGLKKNYKKMPHIFIGAVYESFDLKELAGLVLSNQELSDARIQVQLHKIIWSPDERGV